MTSRGEATTETGQERGDPPWTVFHTGTSLTETLRRTIPAERAIYLLPIVLFFFSSQTHCLLLLVFLFFTILI